MMDSVSWDDDIPNIWKVIKFHVPNHQAVHIALDLSNHASLTSPKWLPFHDGALRDALAPKVLQNFYRDFWVIQR